MYTYVIGLAQSTSHSLCACLSTLSGQHDQPHPLVVIS